MRENNTGSAESARNDAGLDDAITHGAGGLVAAATNNRRARRQASQTRSSRRNGSGDIARLITARKNGRIDTESLQHRRGPLPPHDIEQSSARRVRDFGGEFAGEPETKIVL